MIEAGYEVFLAETDRPFGAVLSAKPRLLVHVENAGEFEIPMDAVKDVHFQKVIVDEASLDADLRAAIRHAHDAERDPATYRSPE